ncbi:MAG: DNA polymerase III subunit epsilon, partial [Candidatus Sedimenticola endophacoides]
FGVRRLPAGGAPLPVILADEQALRAHEARLDAIDQASGGSIWRK